MTGEIDTKLVRWDSDNKLIAGTLHPNNRIDKSGAEYWPNLSRVVTAANGFFKEGWGIRAAYSSEEGFPNSDYPDATKLSLVYENPEISGLKTALQIIDISKCLNPGMLRVFKVAEVELMDEALRNSVQPLVESMDETHYYMTSVTGEFNYFTADQQTRIYQTGVYVLDVTLIDALEYLSSEEEVLARKEAELRPLRERVASLKARASKPGELFPHRDVPDARMSK